MCLWPGKKTRTAQHRFWCLFQNTLTLLQAPQPMEKQGKVLSYPKLCCCDPGLRGLCGENPKSICWDAPGGMQEVLDQPTASIPREWHSSPSCFLGTGTHTGSAGGWLSWEIRPLFPLIAVSNCKKLYQRKLARAGKRTEETGGKPRYFSFSVSIK